MKTVLSSLRVKASAKLDIVSSRTIEAGSLSLSSVTFPTGFSAGTEFSRALDYPHNPIGKAVLNYQIRNLGQEVDTGECTDLVIEALRAAGAWQGSIILGQRAAAATAIRDLAERRYHPILERPIQLDTKWRYDQLGCWLNWPTHFNHMERHLFQQRSLGHVAHTSKRRRQKGYPTTGLSPSPRKRSVYRLSPKTGLIAAAGSSRGRRGSLASAARSRVQLAASVSGSRHLRFNSHSQMKNAPPYIRAGRSFGLMRGGGHRPAR